MRSALCCVIGVAERRARRRWADDLTGGLVVFLVEAAVVLMAVVASLGVAALVLWLA